MNDREEKTGRIIEEFFKVIPRFFKDIHRPPIKRIGLNRSQLILLFFLKDGEVCLKDISKKSYISKGMLSIAANSLARRGYIERVEDDKDRRRDILTITSKGKKILEEFREGIKLEAREKFLVLSDEEMETLLKAIRILKKVSENINRGR